MKVLLDTNIVIHREASKGINPAIGYLFHWLDKLKITKCIHPLTVEEIERNKDKSTVKVMAIKMNHYHLLKTTAAFDGEILQVSSKTDRTNNDIGDSKILNEVFKNRVDFLISEDKKIHKKASLLNIGDRVFTIESFLEKVTAENPSLTDYKVLSVRKLHFGDINLEDEFFDSFRQDYEGFDKWFNKKADEIAYVCYQDDKLSAFLFVKVEDENENYSDISPILTKKKRLKIGTFKVTSNGYKLGERFLKIIFDNAYIQRVQEIYVTIFNRTPEQQRLIQLLQEWGFLYHGTKTTKTGEEHVYTKDLENRNAIDVNNPKLTYPFISRSSDVYIVPIWPEYHTELFPDSKLRTESALDFIENEPHRNALSKVYISRSVERGLKSGDIILFYRTGSKYESVITTIGVVESIVAEIRDESHFISLCRKRSVFTDEKLKEEWNYKPYSRPFVVNFLYVASLPKRPNLDWLVNNGIISSVMDAPRGFRKISRDNFDNIAKYAYK